MFDQEAPGHDAWLEQRAQALDLIDEADMQPPSPHVGDAEFAAWAAELEGCTLPTHPEVIAAAEHSDVTPSLVAQLAAINPEDLDDDARIGLAVCWSRVRNYADAMLGRTVAIQAAATTSVGGPRDVVRIEAERLAAAELAGALRLGAGAADALVFVAGCLDRRLRATGAAVRSGAVSWAKASTLAYATAMLDTAMARAVEAKVLPDAARRTPARHADACRRWVDRIDPEGAAERRRKAKADVRLIAMHHGAGMGELFAAMPSEELDIVWTAADLSARREKEAGDARTLDELRVAALVRWAEEFLADQQPQRHGRTARQRVVWDLTSLLGVTAHCAELLDSGATLPPDAARVIVDRGVRVRRMLIDPDSGELLDLTPKRWVVDPVDGSTEIPPVELHVVLETWLHTALTTGDLTGCTAEQRALVHAVCAALAGASTEKRELVDALLAAPATADDLDARPDVHEPSAALAEFVALRDRHPTNPTAGPSSAAAGDLDHCVAFADGGRTVRDNLTSVLRRWHLLKTHAGWSVRREGRGWRWTSPAGRSYVTEPYDYRLGP